VKSKESVNKNLLYHKIRKIWNKDFSNIIPFSAYYKQIAGQIHLYHSFSKVEKAIWMRSQSNMIQMTIDELELNNEK
jgi:predicted transcriptional regulator